MHAHGGVAQQRAARPGEAVRVHGHQWVGVALAHQVHLPQAILELRLHARSEFLGWQRQQGLGLFGAGRDHGRAHGCAVDPVVGQRQDGQRAVIAKALVRRLVVRQLVAHAADDDRAAEVGHGGADAELAARGGKAAVGGHHQRRFQALGVASGVGVFQCGVGGAHGHARDFGAADDLHACGARGHFVGRAAQCMVGHDPPQVLYPRAAGVQLHGTALAHGTVVHLGFAQQADLVLGQALPAAQALQRGHTGMGEGDFTPVGRRGSQRLFGLLLHQGGAEAGLGQCDGQGQTGGAGADDEHVAAAVHLLGKHAGGSILQRACTGTRSAHCATALWGGVCIVSRMRAHGLPLGAPVPSPVVCSAPRTGGAVHTARCAVSLSGRGTTPAVCWPFAATQGIDRCPVSAGAAPQGAGRLHRIAMGRSRLFPMGIGIFIEGVR